MVFTDRMALQTCTGSSRPRAVCADLAPAASTPKSLISGGPDALIAAEHKAAKLAAKFGEDFEAEWCLATPFILQLANGIDPTKSDPSAAPNGAAAHPPDSPSSGTPNTSHSNYSMEARNRACVLTRHVVATQAN